jgi:uncharacterized membrane protein YjdF
VRCITTLATRLFIYYVGVTVESKGLHTVTEETCIYSIQVIICSIQGPTRCTFLCILYTSLFLFLALHVSGAICTHPQEHNCSVQPWVCVSVDGRGL